MKALIYNLRGFGSGGRRTQLRDYMKQHSLDILGLQETIKQDFSTAELRSLECGGQFAWNWLPADGHSGGLLLGFRDECFEVGSWKKGTFFLSASVFQRKTRLKWCFFLVYGPADHRRTDEFLVELEREVLAAPFPVVVGGDFNLIRTAGDKSNDNICWPRVRRFNEAIASMALRELCRVGARFTWTNRQLNPIRCALDRVLVSPAWEATFPLCSLTAVTRIGSDHTPLLLDSGEEAPRRQPRFFFQTWWFGVRGFQELMSGKLGSFLESRRLDRCSIDVWQRVARNSRQFLKGWGANLGKEKRLFKESLLAQVADLDRRADSSGLDEDDWALRYFLEDQLISLDRLDEEYWRQRSRVQWTLKGDSCTAYFHAIANGRRRKCAIPRLITEHGEIEDQSDLMKHVYDFYIGLMGSAGEERVFSLAPNLWGEDKQVSPAENLALELTFTQEELDEVLSNMKTDTAPGPDGLPVSFFKRFWGTLRTPILQLLNDFVLGRVDIARLNFGVISLIPKVPGADSIRQFRPIALINVIFKFVAKAYAIRLAPLAHRIIDRSQTAFIRGRCLHEGVLALHEIAHELRTKKLGGLLLKLDFEKTYDRVNWDFLREVLLRKGFSGMMVHRLMQLVMGGQTAINVNGEVGAFFRNVRGVRQGDPLSPILFDFMVDGLAAMLSKANEAGHIEGVVPHLIPGGGYAFTIRGRHDGVDPAVRSGDR
jgi:exonuclease III